MSRFNNVKVLLDTAENYNLDEITHLVYRNEEEQEAYELAEDIAFVLITMWAAITPERQKELSDILTNEMVDIEIERMFRFEKPDDTHCRNCAGAMWWEDDGWAHQSGGYCIGPDPYLGDI